MLSGILISSPDVDAVNDRPAVQAPAAATTATAASQSPATQAASAGQAGVQARISDDALNAANSSSRAAVRQFKPGDAMQYGYVIYNAKVDKATNRPQLQTQLRVFRDGKQVFEGAATPFNAGSQQDMKRLLAGGAMQFGKDMPPGDYILQIIITDLLADEKHRTATEWIDFEILQ